MLPALNPIRAPTHASTHAGALVQRLDLCIFWIHPVLLPCTFTGLNEHSGPITDPFASWMSGSGKLQVCLGSRAAADQAYWWAEAFPGCIVDGRAACSHPCPRPPLTLLAPADTLKQRQLYNNTLILWSADHGDGQADHHHWRKGFPYEFSSHIPMIFKWPASWDASVTVAKGSTLPHITELRDVFPTMLDAAGASGVVPANYSMDGDSGCLVGKPCRPRHRAASCRTNGHGTIPHPPPTRS